MGNYSCFLQIDEHQIFFCQLFELTGKAAGGHNIYKTKMYPLKSKFP